MKKKREPEDEQEKKSVEDTEQPELNADAIETDTILPISNKIPAEKLDKITQLKLKINEARKLNNKAVLDEERRLNDPNYQKKEKKKKNGKNIRSKWKINLNSKELIQKRVI